MQIGHPAFKGVRSGKSRLLLFYALRIQFKLSLSVRMNYEVVMETSLVFSGSGRVGLLSFGSGRARAGPIVLFRAI